MENDDSECQTSTNPSQISNIDLLNDAREFLAKPVPPYDWVRETALIRALADRLEATDAGPAALNMTELGMVRRALNLPEADWRSTVSRDEQCRLLVTIDSRDREIYILQNAIENIANIKPSANTSGEAHAIARRALTSLKVTEVEK